MVALDRQIRRDRKVVAVRPEIARNHDLRRVGCQMLVGEPQGATLWLREIERQNGLVHLHPVGARRLELRQKLGIDGEQRIQQ